MDFLRSVIATGLVSLPVLPHAGDVGWQQGVAVVFGRPGSELPGGVYRISLPRSDLTVVVDGIKISPPLALSSWLAFRQGGERATVVGELILTDDEVNPVMTALLAEGLEVTALHGHLLRDQPSTVCLHVAGHGGVARLATGLRTALTRSRTPLRESVPVATASGPIDLEVGALDRTLGYRGRNVAGIYQYSIPRAERIRDGDDEVPPAMGAAIVINFQPTGEGRAAVSGNLVLTARELTPVLKALREHEIEVTAVHNHLLEEQPRLFFLHFWAHANALWLADGLHAALALANLVKK